MANTNTIALLSTGVLDRIVHFTCVSDGTQETNLVLYDADNSNYQVGFQTPNGTRSNIRRAWISTSTHAATLRLNFDQSTPIMALALPTANAETLDFRDIGGLPHPNGTGSTGDITFTSLGLIAGDYVSVTLEIRAD